MKIYVLSRERMDKLMKSEGVNPNDFYITVKCPIETHFAISEDVDNVLKLEFDDSIVKESPETTLFDSHMANKIADFFVRMLSTRKKTSRLFVNCGAGISRSGAIGEIVNIFFNRFKETDDEDYYEFYQVNPQIQPNMLVKNMLMERLLF